MYGLDGSDQTHNVVVNFTYQLPRVSKLAPNGIVHWVVDDWAFNHTQYSALDYTARFDPGGNQVNPRFGQVVSTRSPRVLQGSLRFPSEGLRRESPEPSRFLAESSRPAVSY